MDDGFYLSGCATIALVINSFFNQNLHYKSEE